MSFYIAFLVIFFIWAMGKGWAHRRQDTEQRATRKVLEAIARQMGIPESEYKATDTKKLDAKVGEVANDRKGNSVETK